MHKFFNTFVMPGVVINYKTTADIICNIKITSSVRVRHFKTQKRVETATSQL
jgi:hypothetical protein